MPNQQALRLQDLDRRASTYTDIAGLPTATTKTPQARTKRNTRTVIRATNTTNERMAAKTLRATMALEPSIVRVTIINILQRMTAVLTNVPPPTVDKHTKSAVTEDVATPVLKVMKDAIPLHNQNLEATPTRTLTAMPAVAGRPATVSCAQKTILVHLVTGTTQGVAAACWGVTRKTAVTGVMVRVTTQPPVPTNTRATTVAKLVVVILRMATPL